MQYLQFEQHFPRPGAAIEAPDQTHIRQEPLLRRASVPFAFRHGGAIIREILRKAEALGVLGEHSRVMVQRSYSAAFPSPFHWHLDYMPGTPGDMADQLVHPTSGVIVNVQSNAIGPTTQFISHGTVNLDAEQAAAPTYRGISHFRDEAEGDVYWYNAVINRALQDGVLQMGSVDANTLYAYDSTNFHRPPWLGDLTDVGRIIRMRIIARINTPHPDAPVPVPPSHDEVLRPDTYYYFTRKPDDSERWQKHKTLSHPSFTGAGESIRAEHDGGAMQA